MEHLLSQAAAELAVRSEVEATMSSLLHDVEHAHSLERSLRAHNELHRCQEQLASLRARYEERETAWEADRREKERLGVMLLEEVVKLSAREVEGDRSREGMERRLRQLEEEKRTAAWTLAAQQDDAAVGTVKEDGKVEAAKVEGDANQPVPAEKGQSVSEANIPADGAGEKQVVSDTTIADKGGLGEATGASPTPAAPTSTEPNDQAFVPHELDETTLMNIFAYSDPMDVMNFAQTNKALLAKVNEMFGMSGGEESDFDQSQTTGPGEAAASVENTEKPPLQPQNAAPASTPSTAGQTAASTATATTATSSITSSPAKSSPKLFGMAGPSHRRQGSGTSIATTGSGGSANPFSQVSSWFGASDAPSGAATTAANAAANSPATPADAGSEIKLNAAMASSMASKLTPAELSIILRMREKLQKCEADANKWRLEKEDAVANLASVEAVKEFLVARVRDTERAVQKQKEDMKAVQSKSLEDQEVIVFLDESSISRHHLN